MDMNPPFRLMFLATFTLLSIGTIESWGKAPPILVRNPASPMSSQQISDASLNDLDRLEQDRLDFIRRKDELISKIKALKKQESQAKKEFEQKVKQTNLEIKEHAKFLFKLRTLNFNRTTGTSTLSVEAFEDLYEKLKVRLQHELEVARAEQSEISQRVAELQFELEDFIRDKKADIKFTLYKIRKIKATDQWIKVKRASLDFLKLTQVSLRDFTNRDHKLPFTGLSIPRARAEYSAVHSNGVTEFVRYEVPGDGDCGFHSLGLKRDEAIAKIRNSLSNQVIRRMYAGAIFADNAAGEFETSEPGD